MARFCLAGAIYESPAFLPPLKRGRALCKSLPAYSLKGLPNKIGSPFCGKYHRFVSKLNANRDLRNAPPYLSFRSCPKRKTAPRPGLRVAAAGDRRRRPGISAAAPFAGCREPLSPRVRTGDFPQGGKHNGTQRAMRQGGGRKKRALRAIDSSVFDTLYARLPDLCADCIQVGSLFTPIIRRGHRRSSPPLPKARRRDSKHNDF